MLSNLAWFIISFLFTVLLYIKNKNLFWFDIESCLVYCSMVRYQLVNLISQSASWDIYAAKTYFSDCIPCHEFAWFSNIIKTKDVSVAFLRQRGGLHNPEGCRNGGKCTALNLCQNGDIWWCFVRVCHTEVGLRKDTWLDNSNLPFRSCAILLLLE